MKCNQAETIVDEDAICDLLWRTTEQVAATNYPFSREPTVYSAGRFYAIQ